MDNIEDFMLWTRASKHGHHRCLTHPDTKSTRGSTGLFQFNVKKYYALKNADV